MESITSNMETSLFKLSTGKSEGGTLKFEQQCGHGIKFDHPQKPFYELSFWMFEKKLYLCRNRDQLDRYTLFAEKVGEDETPTFRRPVGRGYVSDSLKTHLEIQLSLPRQRVFLSLFPEQR